MTRLSTYSGSIDIVSTEPDDIKIWDIAHALSNLCRWTGHTNVFYSVAQHSMVVADMLPDELKLVGLLHDAPEAYLSDVAKPLKELLPDYRDLECRLYRVIAYKFGLPEVIPDTVKKADKESAVMEYDRLIGAKARVAVGLEPWQARRKFMDCFYRYAVLQDGAVWN